jgi:hypothetical protein
MENLEPETMFENEVSTNNETDKSGRFFDIILIILNAILNIPVIIDFIIIIYFIVRFIFKFKFNLFDIIGAGFFIITFRYFIRCIVTDVIIEIIAFFEKREEKKN